MEGLEDVENWIGIHAKDLSLVPVDPGRTARALKGVDGYLTGAVEAQAVERANHVGRVRKEGGAVEALEIAEHSTILCAGVSGRAAHCPYLFAYTHDSGEHNGRGYTAVERRGLLQAQN
jgi:hypothetical protein